MNHVEFIAGAYALTIVGLAGLLVASWTAMRAAERAAAEIRERRR